MKKFVLLILCLAAIIFFVFIYPYEYNKDFSTTYTIQKSGEQFNSSRAFQKWFTPFAGNPGAVLKDADKSQSIQAGDYTLILDDIRYGSSVFHLTKQDASLHCKIEADVDSTNNFLTKINLSYKATLWHQWVSKKDLIDLTLQNFENLKDYLLDTKAFYGYLIERDKVADTSVLFKKVTVPLSEKRNATKKVFDELIQYAAKTNAGYNGTRMVYPLISQKEVTLFVGIGVTNFVENDEKAEIIYKRMPYQKNLIVATYQGPYGEAFKAYNALEEYRKDYSLTSMAIPYQKILSDGYDFAEDQIVQMKIFMPVY